MTTKTLLIIDDDPDVLEMLSEIFTAQNFKVVTATDGLDGTLKFNNQSFDLIISDIKMPKKDGIRFVQHVQNTEALRQVKKQTPIILISASLEEFKLELELLEHVKILPKPFSPKQALELVDSLLHIERPITERSGIRVLRPGEALITEGDGTSDELYFVKEGSLRVLKKNEQGIPVPITMIKAGEMVGEVGLLLRHQIRTATVEAISECTLISIPFDKFKSIMDAQPKWFKVLFETVSNRLEETTALLAKERSHVSNTKIKDTKAGLGSGE